MSAVGTLRGLDRDYPMGRFYALFGGSRQGTRQAALRQLGRKAREAAVLDLVRSWRMSHPRMGSRSMYKSLSEKGVDLPMGINAFERLLSREHLTVGRVRRFVPKTSDGKGKNNYPNLCNGLVLDNTGQLLATDITFFWLNGKWSYLFVLKDVYSQRLLGLYPSWDMTKESALEALESAVRANPAFDWDGCIHHSDNGSQYQAKNYIVRLGDLGMKVSRAEGCQQNGSCEQMNHIVKNMYLKPMHPQNMAQMRSYCRKVLYLMNHERAVEQLGYRTVTSFEAWIEGCAAEERPKKKLYDFTSNA